MHKVDQGIPVVQHHVRCPAGPQDPAHFSDGPLDARGVVEHAERVNSVEALVREVKSLGIAKPEVDRYAATCSELPGQREAVLGQIDRGHLEAPLSQLAAVTADAAADLEQPAILAARLPDESPYIIVLS